MLQEQYNCIKKIIESHEDHKTKVIFVLYPFIFFKVESYSYNHKMRKPLKVEVMKATTMEIVSVSPSLDGALALMNWCDDEEAKILKQNSSLKDTQVLFPDSPYLAGIKFKKTKVNVKNTIKELESIAPTVPVAKIEEIMNLSDKELYPDTYKPVRLPKGKNKLILP